MVATAKINPSVISQLFKAAGIERVVFVDDGFGVTYERVQFWQMRLRETLMRQMHSLR